MLTEHKKVYYCRWATVDKEALDGAIAWCGGWKIITPGTSVLIKPNLTFPFHKPGVTTAPDMIRALVELLLDHRAKVTICEAGPSLGVFSTQRSFEDHGLFALREQYGITVVDLSCEPVDHMSFGHKPEGQHVPVPRLLADSDVFISMPVVKVHAMTTVSLALKNQWGLIPTQKRFLLHPAIDDILTGLTACLPHSLVVCDARTSLDINGPMFGVARSSYFLAVSDSIGAFDVAVTKLMGFDPLRVRHIKAAIMSGLAPGSLSEITFNTDPMQFRPFEFSLRRTLQNYIALTGFRVPWICRLGYDSVVSGLLHRVLYAIKPNPLDAAMREPDSLTDLREASNECHKC